jgi:membrane protein
MSTYRPLDRTAIEDPPEEAPVASWTKAIKDSGKRFKRVEATDRAAGMTYYGVLAIFPAALALVSLISLVGNPEKTIQTLLDLVEQLGPASAVDQLRGPMTRLANVSSGRVAFVIGIVLAIWSASSYIGTFGRAVNGLYGVTEGRGFIRLRGTQLLLTLLALVTGFVLASALTLSGSVLQAVGDAVNARSVLVTSWQWARWPLVVLLVAAFLAVLYHFAPNVRPRRFRPITPGSLLALIVGAAGSVLFAFYVSRFGSYGKTYGSLAGVIITLVWFWLSNLAILFGACLDVEIERHRELAAGVAADPDPLLPLRGTKTSVR